jgi:hypothetical protein
MKETEYFVSLQKSVIMAEQSNVMTKRDKLIGTIEYLML